MLRQEGENLTRGFEDETHDRADEPGQEGAQLLTDSLKPLSYSFCAGLKPVQPGQGKSAENHTDSQGHGLQGPAVLLEDVLNPLPKGQPFLKLFSLLFKLVLLLAKLGCPLGILYNSFTSPFTYRRLFIFIICNRLVLFDSLPNLFFLLSILLDFSVFNLNTCPRVEPCFDLF